MRTRFKRLAVTAAAALCLLAPASAHAGIWQPLTTPDTVKQQMITALGYQGGTLWFGTSQYIYQRSGAGWVKHVDAVGSNFTAIAFNPSGTTGIAVGKAGVLWRYNAGVWTKLASPMTYNFRWDDCWSPGSYTLSSPVTEDFTGVRWTDENTVYLFSKRYASLLRSTNKGASFNEINRQSNGSCWFNGSANDIFVLPGNPAYMVIHTGRIFLSTTGLTTNAADRGSACGNRMEVDPQNPARITIGGPGCWEAMYSEDGGSSFRWATMMNGPERQPATFAARGSTVLGAGDAGYVFNGITPGQTYLQPADGALLTNDWRSSALASESVGALGGANGSLVVSSQLDTVPDIVKPTGSVSGPETGTVGAPLTFTADVADTGGSGIDPDGFIWTRDSTGAGTGQTLSLTFAQSGWYTLTVGFKDRAGNAATASKTVRIADVVQTVDRTDPTGKITGPAYAVAGDSATFTINATDAGSGVDPSSFRWTRDSRGVAATGATASIPFPEAGVDTVAVRFRDNAGNDGFASVTVPVAPKPEDRPKPTTAPGTIKPTIKPAKGGKFTIPIKGGYTLPKGVTATLGCKGEIIFTMKKVKTLISARSTTLNKQCRYAKRFTVAKKKVGSAKKVAITIRFPGNPWLAPVKKTYQVKVPGH
jgi:hypothetical protein